MMNKLQVSHQKTLKLTNVLSCKLNVSDESLNFEAEIQKMQTYIKTKGGIQVGPLIQYTRTELNETGEVDMELVMMLQCNHFIHKTEEPYSMEAVLRVPDCMYCRFVGNEDKIHFGYDKINLEAFENDIVLKDCSYTIFVDRNDEDEIVVADIFVPKQ